MESEVLKDNINVLMSRYPEVGAGGFTSQDGTIEFYTRINALLEPGMTVLDFGAGHGAALMDSQSSYKIRLMALKSKVTKLIACDVDETVLDNPGADETVLIQPDKPLPFADEFFDLIVSNFVFEHIQDPALVSAELRRILKPHGWICARTPNKYSLISFMSQLVHDSKHSLVLRWVQPSRKPIDVFPTTFKLNSKSDISKWFQKDTFHDFTYRYEAEPSYFFHNRAVLVLMMLINRLSPSVMKSGLFIFLRKKGKA